MSEAETGGMQEEAVPGANLHHRPLSAFRSQPSRRPERTHISSYIAIPLLERESDRPPRATVRLEEARAPQGVLAQSHDAHRFLNSSFLAQTTALS